MNIGKLAKRYVYREAFEEQGSAGGGAAAEGGSEAGESSLDISSAVDSISESLGFKADPVEKKEPEAAATAETDPSKLTPAPATPAEKQPEGTQPPAPAATPLAVAPKTWKPEEAAVWAQIPEAAKAAIVRREEDIFRGVEQYKTKAAFGSTVEQAIAPFRGIMEAHGIDPVQNISSLMNAHYQLATGTQESKLQLFKQLAADYRVDLSALSGEPNPYEIPADPQVVQLQQTVEQLQAERRAEQQQRYQAQQEQVAKQISEFASSHPHFDTVADDIAVLLKADKSLTLEQAYEKAVWANATTREQEIARLNAEKQSAAQAQAAQQAAGAKKAMAANIQTQPKAGAATEPLGSMDDTLAEALASIRKK